MTLRRWRWVAAIVIGAMLVPLAFFVFAALSFQRTDRAQTGDNFTGPIETATCRDYRDVFSEKERTQAAWQVSWIVVTGRPGPSFDGIPGYSMDPEAVRRLNDAHDAIDRGLRTTCPTSDRSLVEVAREASAAAGVR